MPESVSAQSRRQTVAVLEQIPEEDRKIAEGALDRLCDWQAGTGEWLTTAERIANFQRAFILMASERVAAVSRREDA